MTAVKSLVPVETVARITRTQPFEIIRPLGRDWDDVGSLLRRQRSLMHRLMNGAVLACIDAHRKLRPEHPRTAAYQGAIEALVGYKAWAAKHKDPSVREKSTIELPGGTISAVASIAHDFFGRWKKEHGNVGIPSFKKGQPIPLRAQEAELQRDARGFVLSAKVEAGRTGAIRFALAHVTGRPRDIARKIVEGKDGYRSHSVKLDWDERHRKWFALVSYSYPKPPPLDLDPKRIMVVHRGVHNFLVCVSSAGHYSKIPGAKLVAFKRRIGARRISQKRIAACERGTGAKGHGVQRRYATSEALREYERRFVKTFCEQSVAHVARLAGQWGCGTVVIGDYGGIEPDEERSLRRFIPRFPLHQLKTRMGHALEALGFDLVEVSEAYVSQTCPRCGNQDASQHVRGRGNFHCHACAFERPADMVSALLMLRRCDPEQNVWDDRLKEQYKIERMLREVRDSQSTSEAEQSGDSTPQTRGNSAREGAGSSGRRISENGEAHSPPSRRSTSKREQSRHAAKKGQKVSKKTKAPKRGKTTARKPRRKGAE